VEGLRDINDNNTVPSLEGVCELRHNESEGVGVLTSKPLFTYITGKSTAIYNKLPKPTEYETVKIRANECNL
jgi:hypothetical protein